MCYVSFERALYSVSVVVTDPDGDSDTTSVVVVMGNAVEEVMSLLQLKKEKISGKYVCECANECVSG